MASKLASVGKVVVQRVNPPVNNVQIPRNMTTTATGGVQADPEKTPMGLLKLALTVLPGLWIGATVSKTGAAFLEENDIFVPDDDDDDDD